MQLASWVRSAKPSFIREILKVSTQPGILSFAGGMPAPESFPVHEIEAAYAKVLAEQGTRILQYSISEGDPDLRAVLAEDLTRRGTPCTPDQVLLTNGSQHGLDLLGKALIDPGSVVLVEDPTYLGAIQAWQPYGVRLVTVPTDDEGMLPDALEAAIKRENPRMVYVLPTFSNPRGTTMGIERRAALAAICQEAKVLLVDDDPYSELRYRGEQLPGLRHFWDQVVYLGTHSKTLAPALRLGWIVASEPVMSAVKLGLQATSLNVGALTQRVAATVMRGPAYQPHLQRLRAMYSERMLCMLAALERYCPEGVTWSRPDGGLFLWLTLPEGCRSMDLFKFALEKGVAFVPGEPFFVGAGGERSMRLNFSYCAPEQIERGMKLLGDSIREMLAQQK